MTEPAEQTRLTRAERKERTRRALLDGTLTLLEDRDFSGLSIREIARSAGIVPTAFYRHFASLDDLGVTLVEDAMRMLRGMLRDIRRDGTPTVDSAVTALTRHAGSHPGQFRFLLRERHGGTEEVRRAIDTELRLLSRELAIDLARAPGIEGVDAWPTEDLETAAGLLVATAADAVPALADPQRPGAPPARGAGDELRRRLRMVTLGMTAWRPAM